MKKSYNIITGGLLGALAVTVLGSELIASEPAAVSDESNLRAVAGDKSRLGRPNKEGFRIKLTDEEVRLLNQLKTKKYMFGWSGGIANKLDNQKSSFFKVTPVRVDIKNRYVILQYAWKNGVLNARINGREMFGDWVQSDDSVPFSTDSGRFHLKFSEDLESATGWWHDDWQLGADAKPIKRWAYFRVARQ